MTVSRGIVRFWEPEDDALLRQYYGKMPTRELAKLVRHSVDAVRSRAARRRIRHDIAVSPDDYHDTIIALAWDNGIRARRLFVEQKRDCVRVRWVAWKALRDKGVSYSSIARASGFNHCTVMYGVKRLAALSQRAAE